jgi:hypothetical protein
MLDVEEKRDDIRKRVIAVAMYRMTVHKRSEDIREEME